MTCWSGNIFRVHAGRKRLNARVRRPHQQILNRGAREPVPTDLSSVLDVYHSSPAESSVQHGLGGPWRSGKDWAALGPLNVGLSGSVSRLLSWLLMTMVNRIHHGVTSVKYTVPVQLM